MKTPKSAKSGSKAKSEMTSSAQSSSAAVASKPSEVCGVRQIGNEVVFVTFCPDAKTVKIGGEFNNWQADKNPMKKLGNEGLWQLKIKLKPGTYRYRLVVDGNWQQDPFNSNAEPNPYGQFNSLVTVK
jgi:1,4-alpha-glucan branching enzyme